METLTAERPEDRDQHAVLYGKSWMAYDLILAAREGDEARIFYLHGDIELASSSRGHVETKAKLTRLLEAYGKERRIPIRAYGPRTVRSALAERGAEPDASYVVGEGDGAQPDLVMEIVWTDGGLDKLEIYRGLGVGEVWIWDRNQGLQMFSRRAQGERYERAERSRLFPDLDPEWLVQFLNRETPGEAEEALLSAMRAD